jgi:hypothetical protein
MKRPVLFALLSLLAASLACNLVTASSGSGTEQPSKVLFKDDFSDSSSGWNQVRDADGVTDYENETYHILINTIGESGNGMSYWARPDLGSQMPVDLKIEVDATKNSGPDDNDFGVICRYTRNNDLPSFYQFMVTSDGYVGITLVNGDDQKIISSEDEKLQPSDLVKQGEASNHIRADCVGSTLTLYVNGTKAASATDTTLSKAGDVGVIAGTYSSPGTDIFFDNFIVSQP